MSIKESGTQKITVIAARERGPGPGRYGLPSTCGSTGHDYTKHQKPAYSFGRRLIDDSYKKHCSPGPRYKIDSTITRRGADGTPAYSMLARQEGCKPFKTPGPGAYRPEQAHPQGERQAPRYSLAARTRFSRRCGHPAPNAYSLPKVLGANQPDKQAPPVFSMRPRQKIGGYLEDLAKTPGPGRYDVIATEVYRGRAPLYTMRNRHYMPGDSTQKPGPGAHFPENVVINTRQQPRVSMGIRHSEFICPLIVPVSD
ncbi:LOW QUALITY PROTEIN: ciliary microtubule associated protein 1A-like [Liolophura sinensis]|uniref:LOW QUALITY PROTEIN: ciliary microtubule associated protein 1A-like n=1 Tax=Liolophura sinensis TaxID=3198878 RepID=UPI003158A491